MKLISIILSTIAMAVALYVYLTRPECQEDYWWVVLLLGIINLLFIVLLLFSKYKQSEDKEDKKVESHTNTSASNVTDKKEDGSIDW